MAEAVIQQDRDNSPSWDQSPSGEERARAGQDGVVGANIVDRGRKGPPIDERSDRRVGGGIAEGEKSQAARWDPLRHPRHIRYTNTAILIEQEGPRSSRHGTRATGTRSLADNVVLISIMLLHRSEDVNNDHNWHESSASSGRKPPNFWIGQGTEPPRMGSDATGAAM